MRRLRVVAAVVPSTNPGATPANNVITNTALVTDGRAIAEDQVSVTLPEYASIGDRVWLDEDGDGIQDAGEDGVAGVAVTAVLVAVVGVLSSYDVLRNKPLLTLRAE